MKIVNVTYTTAAAYAETNMANIRKVMAELQALQHAGIFYHACIGADGKTFIHNAFFKTDADHKTLTELGSFKTFQEQLRANGFETPPKQELLTLVGSSSPLFK